VNALVPICFYYLSQNSPFLGDQKQNLYMRELVSEAKRDTVQKIGEMEMGENENGSSMTSK
jgi:hypothetical protein